MDRFSHHFDRPILLTRHAVARMRERGVGESLIEDLIERAAVRDKDASRKWIYKAFPDRADNLVCAAVSIEDAVVVKTVMVNWRLVEE
ncbi:MAG: DUF4258 domain-containing protein [Deferrisomatales bacterium]